MLLVHDGKISYSDHLTEVFPDFPEYGKAITIRHLLTHTSGLLDYEDLMAKQYGNTPDEQIPQIKDAGVLELLKREKTTKFTPGTRWDYSNSAYCLLAMVVEKKSGRSFGEFLKDEFSRRSRWIRRSLSKKERMRLCGERSGTPRPTKVGGRQTRVRRPRR
jgi:CubicO group peptidase (beta-lactamase class C family)